MLNTDLNNIKNLAKQRRDENFAFRSFLKNHPSKNLDQIVFKLNDEVSSQIDCTKCANCCKQMQPAVTDEEAIILAEEKKVTTENFKQDFLEADEFEKINYFKIQPCIFLKENKCSCYEKRPASCAEYPYLNKPGFRFRLLGVLSNYEICPIVFNVIEKLKLQLNWKNH